MSYKTAFPGFFDLGFEEENFPVQLIDKSYKNDICPSFHFKIGDQHFVLWVDYEEKSLREIPENSRYTITYGLNLGDNDYLEIYDDHTKPEVLKANDILKIKEKVYDLLERSRISNNPMLP